jgi:hypothetical protein
MLTFFLPSSWPHRSQGQELLPEYASGTLPGVLDHVSDSADDHRRRSRETDYQ